MRDVPPFEQQKEAEEWTRHKARGVIGLWNSFTTNEIRAFCESVSAKYDPSHSVNVNLNFRTHMVLFLCIM